ncbi:MAG: type II CAAX endopeptidase family protein [Anaerolineaceae bacterium]|nr:type II CAAX endopeptidase family protein [Anaerolineaceae bacterium]MDD4043604.1 type II CAAX endopeptidase family protein [Anaerolineaceae bacterium]MDD4578142.1 type II CAAX endopeptidase family protein [Anaerolineaceae bacterium]
MDDHRFTLKEWGVRVAVALVFVALGLLLYIVFSPLRPWLDKSADYLGRIAVTASLLVVVWVAGKNEQLKPYRTLLLVLLIMSVAISLDWVFAIYLLEYMGLNTQTASGIALLKLNEFFIVASTIISLTLLTGGSLGSIYIQKGNLKLGLLVGGIAFFLSAAASPWMARFMFNGQDLTPDRLRAWLPWVLIFALANAAQEELLFRGLFLRKLEPFFGKLFSNILIVFVFTLVHQGVNYTSDQIGFLAILSLLAFAWGNLMQKSDSIWGSILFHAGLDIPVILGILSNL